MTSTDKGSPAAPQSAPARSPDGPLAGKTAIVTEAPRSIGRAIAEALAEGGARVVLHYRSRSEQAQATLAALRSSGAEAIAVGGDLSDSAAATALFRAAREQFGGVDIVVANAGQTAPMIPVAEISDSLFDELLAANTRATFYVLREAARTVRDAGPMAEHRDAPLGKYQRPRSCLGLRRLDEQELRDGAVRPSP